MQSRHIPYNPFAANHEPDDAPPALNHVQTYAVQRIQCKESPRPCH